MLPRLLARTKSRFVMPTLPRNRKSWGRGGHTPFQAFRYHNHPRIAFSIQVCLHGPDSLSDQLSSSTFCNPLSCFSPLKKNYHLVAASCVMQVFWGGRKEKKVWGRHRADSRDGVTSDMAVSTTSILPFGGVVTSQVSSWWQVPTELFSMAWLRRAVSKVCRIDWHRPSLPLLLFSGIHTVRTALVGSSDFGGSDSVSMIYIVHWHPDFPFPTLYLLIVVRCQLTAGRSRLTAIGNAVR